MKHQQIRPWTQERVKEEITVLRRRGEPLNGQQMIRHQTLYGHARRLYGTWENALRACGLDYDKIVVRMLWTKEAILEWIQAEWKAKRELRPGATKKRHSGVFNAALREFGSWYRAIRAAGITSFPEVKFKRWSKERVLEAIRSMRAVPSDKDIRRRNRSLAQAADYYFGGWRSAVRAVGLECPAGFVPVKWTLETILKILRERLSRGQGPQSTAFKDLGGFVRAASRQFSGWRNAVKAAGFDASGLMPTRYIWTEKEILRVIRERDLVGQSNEHRFLEQDHPGLAMAGRITFGSWPAAVRAAGCSLPENAKWTKSSVSAHLVAHANEGVSPRAGDLGSAFRAAAGRIYGSWKAAALKSGLDVRPQRRTWTKERVLRAVQRRLKRGLPVSRDHKLAQAVLRIFGGVAAAEREAALIGRDPGVDGKSGPRKHGRAKGIRES